MADSAACDVVVIGAGAAGIGAGQRLVEAGLRVVILEARDRIGGRSQTVATAAGPVDLGCEWLHSADRNPFTAIAQGFGLALDERLPDWGGRLRRLGATAAEEADAVDAARSGTPTAARPAVASLSPCCTYFYHPFTGSVVRERCTACETKPLHAAPVAAASSAPPPTC